MSTRKATVPAPKRARCSTSEFMSTVDSSSAPNVARTHAMPSPAVAYAQNHHTAPTKRRLSSCSPLPCDHMAAPLAFRLLGQHTEVLGVPDVHAASVRVLGEPLGGILPDRLQHPVAPLARPGRVDLGHHQRSFDEP